MTLSDTGNFYLKEIEGTLARLEPMKSSPPLGVDVYAKNVQRPFLPRPEQTQQVVHRVHRWRIFSDMSVSIGLRSKSSISR